MTSNPFTPLRAEESERIEAARDWVKGHFNNDPDECYAPIEAKLFVIDAILSNGWVEREETWKLQALGIAFGDALAQELMMEWVTVDDEYGCDPALNWPGTSILSYPLTAISKHVERDESVNIQDLFDVACSTISEMAFSGRYE